MNENASSIHQQITPMNKLKYKLEIPTIWFDDDSDVSTISIGESEQTTKPMDNTQEEKEKKPVSKQPHKPPKRITRSHGKVYPDKKESKRKHTKKSKEEKKNETSEDPTEHNDKIDGDTTKAETEKKPKHSHCIKKQNFLQSDDEIRSQIALAQQYLSKRKTVTLPRDTIITTSRKLEPKQSVDDKILDLRTHLSTVTIPVSQLPPQIQKHPQPPYS
ncbi:Uncharacterized protein QTN25_003493 [Entamoeba marina]